MDLNSGDNRKELIKSFPNLATDPNFTINSPQTIGYNCIAWAMGFNGRWVQSVNTAGLTIDLKYVWWPPEVPQSQKPDALIEAFKKLGFELYNSWEYDNRYDIAVLYANNGEWTHASRLIGTNLEHSKFGESWDAIHSSGVFHGSMYGDAYAIMRRPRGLKKEYLDKYPLKLGTITVNNTRLTELLKPLRKRP